MNNIEMGLKNALGKIVIQLPGWHTQRKILVIESDDWGCWRTRDEHRLELLSRKLPHILDDPYTRFDTLESSEDIEALFDTLRSVRDINGNHPVITANTIIANPDFQRIKAGDFTTFFYKCYTDELDGDSCRENLMTLVKQGIKDKIYYPQLHGREHVNIPQWLKALRNGHRELLAAFEFEMFGIPLKEKVNIRNNVMAAFDLEDLQELYDQELILKEAQEMFFRTFGFYSTTFISPCYVWHPELERALVYLGVKLIQGLPFQFIPQPGATCYNRKFRFTGKRSTSGVANSVRNAFFEPSLTCGGDPVQECLKRIAMAFAMKKPAVVGSHRLNFIGGIEGSNRSKNLELLKELLGQIKRRWPDVEFMNSSELVHAMNLKNDDF